MRRHALWLLALAAAGCHAKKEAEQVAAFEQVSPDPVAHGKRLATVLGCLGCHGQNLAGEDWSEPGFGRLWTANLTRAAERNTDAQFETVMTTGRRPDGSELWEMPAHLFTKLTDDEMRALMTYIRSLPVTGPMHPRTQLEPAIQREIEAGTYRSSAAVARADGRRDPPDAGPGHEQARHIVRATCAECHGLDLEGGQPYPEAAARPDIRLMAAAYTPKAFDRLLTTGIASGEREVGLMSEVARGRYAHLTQAERRAIHAYLKALGDEAAR